ncbi:MAG: septum formation inhibitor Maf [Lachnospiraceae bacterium]|nr:septum formation inhibitor Maf [Lachnospiraceae bacterium]
MLQTKELILASGSPRRKELLELIGIHPIVRKSDVTEKITREEPGQIVMELSHQKADDVAAGVKDGIVLGADTIVYAQGQILGKPRDRADGFRMLRMLSGKVHSVFTGVTIIQKDQDRGTVCVKNFYRETKVHVHSMTDAEINAYLDTGDPFDKAGAYGIQGPFAAFVDGVEGDYQTVVGLPVCAVYQALKELKADA